MRYSEVKQVDSFQVKSGRLMVTDPCYDRDTWCQGIVENVRNGTWKAELWFSDEKGWGRRVSRLYVYHEDDAQPITLDPVDFEVGVDSGQAGVFDEALYPASGEERGDVDDESCFYGKCCKLTLDQQGGCLEFGAVSRSGFGDGGYGALVGRDKDGVATEVSIEFIVDEEDEDDTEEKEEDEDEDA